MEDAQERPAEGVCVECGGEARDPRGSHDRRRHGGNRVAFRVWLVLLVLAAVAALPWVQVRLGNRLAEMDMREARPPRDQMYPMYEPLIRMRDLGAIASGDEVLGARFREAVLERLDSISDLAVSGRGPVSVRVMYDSMQSRLARLPVQLQNKRRILQLEGMEMRWWGWPYTWYSMSEMRKISYEPPVFEAGGSWEEAPEATILRERDEWRRFRWMHILATLLLVWMCGRVVGWGAARIGAGRGIGPGRARWIGRGAMLAMLVLCAALGSRARTMHMSAIEVPGMEAFFSDSYPEYDAAQLRELISSEDGPAVLAAETLRAYEGVDEPNAVVGLHTKGLWATSSYSFTYGLWRQVIARSSVREYRHLHEDGRVEPVEIPEDRRYNALRFNKGQITAGWSPKSHLAQYSVQLDLPMLLGYGFIALVVLWVLRAVFAVPYRLLQRRRVRRGRCVWCGYPLSETALAARSDAG